MPAEPYDDYEIEDVFERDGELWGRDRYGEFRFNAGASEPKTRDELGYTPCNAVLKYTLMRYGERRYCTGMATSNFSDVTDKESDRCKHHRGRDNIMDLHEDNTKVGAFARSYTSMYGRLSAHEQVIAIEMFRNLLDESRYDFEQDEVDEVIEDAHWMEDDTAVVDFPVPTEHVTRGKYLWIAAIQTLQMEGIQEQIFEDAISEGNAPGEREVVVTVTDSGDVITDMDEHHLNLPISRMIKDHKNLLRMGGVDIEPDTTENITMKREWHIGMDSPPKPEADRGDDPLAENIDEDPYDLEPPIEETE